MNKREQSTVMLARLVQRLADNGVIKEDISSDDFVSDHTAQNEVQIFCDLIDWLSREGVIRTDGGYSGGNGDFVYDLVLTSRGFWLLEQDYTANLTLGAAIKAVSQNGAMTSGLGDFVGGMLGGFTKSISG